MNLSDLIITKSSETPFRAVIYGTDGIGKSTWAADAPNPIFADFENGLKFLNATRVDCRNYSFDEFLRVVGKVIKEEHEFKTFVIDSIDWLETKIFEKVVNEYEKQINSIEQIGYAKGYVIALDHWEKLLSGLDMLVNKKGMNVILIAHGQAVKFQDPQFDDFDKWDLKIHKKAAALMREWADCVLFANYHQYLKTTSDGFSGKDKSKAIGDGERVLYTSEKPQFKAKTRFQIPDKISMNFSEFFEYYNKSINN